MVKKRGIEDLILRLSEPIADAEGQTVVAVEYTGGRSRPTIHVTLHKQGGVTVGDCQRFSSLLGARLDLEEDHLPDGYYLEVSSPGLDRTLKAEREFEVFRGRTIRVNTYAPVDGQKEFTGVLEGADDDHIVISDEEGNERRIPRDMVARAKLHYEIDN